jgi:hypothetical protein
MPPVFMFFQTIFIAYNSDAADFAGEHTTVSKAKALVSSQPFLAAYLRAAFLY